MKFLHQLRAFFRREKFEADMAEELRTHLDLQTQANLADGMGTDAARQAARRSFGGVEQIKERCRDQRSWLWLEQTLQDLRYAAGALRKNPAFSVAAILTLTFGIGATTAIFTLVDTILWRPLPYAASERLVIQSSSQRFDAVTLREWREAQSFLDRVETRSPGTRVLTGVGEASNVAVDALSPGVLELLGRGPAMGRLFSAEDAEPGSPPVAIVSDEFWRNELAGDPAAVGREIGLDDRRYTIVGVMPRGFKFIIRGAKIWVALTRATTEAQLHQAVSLFGRLRPGLSLAAARQATKDLNRQLDQAYPRPGGWQVDLASLGAVRALPVWENMMMLVLGAVGFVLLIACSNVANLLLARATVRRREFAVRLALGAGQGRLFRQVLTESLVLAIAGAAGGLFFAYGAVKLLWLFAPYQLTVTTMNEAALNWRALGLTGGLVGLAAVLCGMVPAWQAARSNANPARSAGARSATGGRSRQRWQAALVVAQTALAVVLLVGAGLLIRGFLRLHEVDPGFETKNLAALGLRLPASRYPSAASRQAFFEGLRERIASLPGVAETSLGTGVPPNAGFRAFGATVEVEGRTPVKMAAAESLPSTIVDDSYFQTLRIPVRRGRLFDSNDGPGTPPVIVINEPMARRFWPGGDPLGQRIRFDARQPWLTVVGVVGDVRAGGPRDEYGVLLSYRSLRQEGYGADETLAVRVTANARGMLPALKRVVAELDPRLAPDVIGTVDDMIAHTLEVPRYALIVMTLFAGAAILLATVGLYGVMSYTVAQRTVEIGIRMALGGSGRDIVLFVARRGLWLTGAGLLIGVGAAVGLTRFLGSQLFEISALDPVTFAGMSAVLGLAGALGCWLPARRAARVSPLEALRAE
jgi:putative ABC transport system permease protein